MDKSSRLTVWLEIFWRLNRKPQTVKNLILRFETKIAKNLGKIDHFSSQFYVYRKLFDTLSVQRYFNSKITFKIRSFFPLGHRYPPPPLSLRPGSEGTSPSFSPDPRPPPHSASARVQHGQFDLNNSLGTMSAKTPSSSTSGGGGAGSGSHFTFNEATPPPRPPPHRPMNSVSHDAAIWKSALSVCVTTQYHVIGFFRNDKKKTTRNSARKIEEELVLLRFSLGDYFFFFI